jgi:hypothetical protein
LKNKLKYNKLINNKNMNKENMHCCFDSNKKIIFIILFVVLSVFLVILSISGAIDIFNKIKQGRYIGQEAQFKNSIIISETGEVYAKPDLAVVNFSVIEEAKTVAEATSKNTETMNNIIKAMKDQGVEDKDLKTISFNLYPRYEYTDDTFSKRILVGYEVSQGLEVKIRNMEKIGTIIEEGTSAGANDVSGLQFTIDNEEDLKKEARIQAIEKAKDKAQELTSQLGIKLGRVISFNENFFVPYYDTRVYLEKAEGIGGGGPAPDIQTGENTITVTITVTYEIY